MSELILPRNELILPHVPELIVVKRVVDHALEPLGLRVERISKKLKDYIVSMAGFADAIENKLLDHIYRAVTLTPPNPLYLALSTGTTSETDVGASLTAEANYTGYLRLSLAPAVFGAASAGEVHNTAQQTFAACTGSSSVVTSWAMVGGGTARLAAGDVYHFGTCTSTTISTTQTPATINASALSMSLD